MRFKYSVRFLLLLTAIVALAIVAYMKMPSDVIYVVNAPTGTVLVDDSEVELDGLDEELSRQIEKRQRWFVQPRVIIRDPPGGQLGNLVAILNAVNAKSDVLSDVTTDAGIQAAAGSTLPVKR
ncbi:MAG: hypothetical protein AAF456_13115 [Planctomycetota bacterium]